MQKIIEVSDNSQIVVSKDTVNGKTFGQVRTWIRKKGTDDFIPTRKGIAFSLDKTDKIVEGLLVLADTEKAES